MDVTLSAIKHWGAVGWRAAVYGTVSCSVGWTPRGRPVSQWCMHRWCLGSARALGLEVAFDGQANLDATPQAILVANHLSTLDILVIGSLLDRDYRWLAKAPLFRVPFMGWHLKFAGHVPVYRGAARARNRSIAERIHEVVQEGASVLFFPEGTRSEDGALKPFKLGAFQAAVAEDLPVLPLVLRGTHELMAKGSGDVARVDQKGASLRVLPAIQPPTEGTAEERAEGLRALTHAAFQQALSKDAE